MLHLRIPQHLALGLAIACSLAMIPAASRAVTVTIIPPDTAVTVGDEFCVRARVDAFPDLEGAQLIYGFDPLRLVRQAVSAGDVFTGAPGGYVDFLMPDVTAPADSIWYEAAVLTGNTAGPGLLAFLCFRAIAEGDAHLACGRVDLRDSFNQQTLAACADAVVHILGPTPARSMSWGRLKIRYR